MLSQQAVQTSVQHVTCMDCQRGFSGARHGCVTVSHLAACPPTVVAHEDEAHSNFTLTSSFVVACQNKQLGECHRA